MMIFDTYGSSDSAQYSAGGDGQGSSHACNLCKDQGVFDDNIICSCEANKGVIEHTGLKPGDRIPEVVL